MTKSQIKVIFDDLGYEFNTMIKANEISVISSDLDGLVYPGDSTRLYFKTFAFSDSGLLEIYYGKEIDGEFVFKGEAPSYTIPFSALYGITMASPIHRLEPYKQGLAV